MQENNKHVQIPKNTDLEYKILKMGDRYIYGVMRSHMNKTTYSMYYKQDTIAKEVGCSLRCVNSAIKRLEQAGWIVVKHRKGTSNEYVFVKSEKFERFFQNFIDLKWGDYKTKDFYILLQPHLFIDKEKKKAYVRYSNYELSKLMHIDFKTVNKYMNALKDSDIVEDVVTTLIDPKTKLPIMEKHVDLDKIGQFMLYKLKEHEDRISNTESAIQELKDHVSKQDKKIDKITKMLEIFLSEIKDAEIIDK